MSLSLCFVHIFIRSTTVLVLLVVEHEHKRLATPKKSKKALTRTVSPQSFLLCLTGLLSLPRSLRRDNSENDLDIMTYSRCLLPAVSVQVEALLATFFHLHLLWVNVPSHSPAKYSVFLLFASPRLLQFRDGRSRSREHRHYCTPSVLEITSPREHVRSNEVASERTAYIATRV